MKIQLFQSDKGDCLFLESVDGKKILVDGGMQASFSAFVAPELSRHEVLDLVYVSHIDQDHIAGILKMMDDTVEWRVHEFQKSNGNPNHRKPSSPKPPAVNNIWHNAFGDLLGPLSGRVGDMLAATSSILSGVDDDDDLHEIAETHREIATSIPEAIKLSKRVRPEQLNIPLNAQFGGKLAVISNTEPGGQISLGSMDIFVIGPFDSDLEKLKEEWGKWLEFNEKSVSEIRRRARRDIERLGTSDVQTLIDLQIDQATRLGDRDKVTTPNLASLMLLVEAEQQGDKKTVLLTGDGHADDIIKGLDFHRKLDNHQQIHVDVLKVPHHLSEHNINERFVSKVTADHYLFCGNGAHQNPDLRALKLLIDSRLRTVPFASKNPKANGNFVFWFNSSATAKTNKKNNDHMKQVRDLVEAESAASGGRLTVEFLDGQTPFFTIPI